MKAIILTMIMVCLVAMPVMAFDVMLGTDYDVASEEFLMIGELSQDWQALTIGATIQEEFSALLDKDPALNNITAWAEMRIDERLTIRAEKDINDNMKNDPIITTVKVRFTTSY